MNNLFGVAQALKNRDYPSLNKPSGLSFRFPFQSQAVTDFVYQIQLQPVKLEWITGVFIDNSLNPQPFQLLLADTGQKITVPAYNQASIELLGLYSDKVSVRGITTGNVDVPVIFLNYVPSGANSIWSVLDPGTVIGTITVNGTVTALPTMATSVDRSLTTGALNTPQSLMPANAARKLMHIFNPFSNGAMTNGGVLAVGIGAGVNVGALGAYEIGPGGSMTFDGFGVPTAQIFISASDANCNVSAREI